MNSAINFRGSNIAFSLPWYARADAHILIGMPIAQVDAGRNAGSCRFDHVNGCFRFRSPRPHPVPLGSASSQDQKAIGATARAPPAATARPGSSGRWPEWRSTPPARVSTQWLRVLHDSTLSLRVPWLPKRPRTGHWDQRWASANIFATVPAQSSMQRSGQTLKGSGRTSLDGGVPVGRCGGMRPGEEVPSLAGVTAVGGKGFGSQESLDGAEVPAGRRHSVRLHSAVCRYSNSSSGGALVRSFLH